MEEKIKKPKQKLFKKFRNDSNKLNGLKKKDNGRGEITIGRTGKEPRRRGDSVNKTFGGELMIEEKRLAFDLVFDPLLPLENLHEQLLYRSHCLFLHFTFFLLHLIDSESRR